MHARGGEADDGVASGDIGARQQRAALGGPNRESGEVIVAILVEAGHFGSLAPDQGAAGFPAALGDARDDGGRSIRIELAARKIIQKKQRLSALYHQIIDRHRDQVDADAAVQTGVDGDFHLGSDAVGRSNQDRILETRGLQVEQAAKPADFGVGSGAGGGANQRLDHVDQPVPGVDIDPCVGVGEAVFSFGHGPSRFPEN